VHQHSGRIWAERNPVRGSSFRVFLPYKPVPIGTADADPEDENVESPRVPEAMTVGDPRLRAQVLQIELVKG